MIDNDADFVIIDKDVLTMEPQRIFETRVLSAYVHGQKVWEKL
jgi:predicted amidohydrolase YtcJ